MGEIPGVYTLAGECSSACTHDTGVRRNIHLVTSSNVPAQACSAPCSVYINIQASSPVVIVRLSDKDARRRTLSSSGSRTPSIESALLQTPRFRLSPSAPSRRSRRWALVRTHRARLFQPHQIDRWPLQGNTPTNAMCSSNMQQAIAHAGRLSRSITAQGTGHLQHQFHRKRARLSSLPTR